MNHQQQTTILMIHGLWCGAWCWEHYQRYFEQQGYRVIAVDLPYHGNHIQHPHPKLAMASMKDYLQFVIDIIQSLDEKPIVIGHSMGGLLAQMLAARNLVQKSVLLCPAPPAGILAMRPSILKTFMPVVLIPNFWAQSIPVRYESAKYAVLNKIEDEEESHCIVNQMGYESGRVLFEIGAWAMDLQHTTFVDAKKIQTPMLILSAEYDNIMPASVVWEIYQYYKHTAEYHCLDNHAHWVLGEKGWEKICQQIQQWIE